MAGQGSNHGRKELLKRLGGDMVYSASALIVMNLMLSVGVYPFLYKKLGPEANGRMLFYTALMGLVASGFGSGMNYGRMKSQARHETHNGDYNTLLLFLALISVLVGIAGSFFKSDTAGAPLVTIIALIFATAVRYYADVEYRLSLNYRGFFFYYLIVAAGYGLGILLFLLTGVWTVIFLGGELCALLFVFFTGRVFKGGFHRSPHFAEDAKTSASLSAAYLMSDFVSYTDRVLLSVLAGDAAATSFYASSIVGKISSLISTPLNGVIAGHLMRYEGRISKKLFTRIFLALLGAAFVVSVGATVGAHLYVWLFYRAEYDKVKAILFLANAAQVLFFMANVMMTVVLKVASEKAQVVMGIAYTVLFFAVAMPAMYFWGIWGAAIGLFTVNLLKLLIITGLGYRAVQKGEVQ